MVAHLSNMSDSAVNLWTNEPHAEDACRLGNCRAGVALDLTLTGRFPAPMGGVRGVALSCADSTFGKRRGPYGPMPHAGAADVTALFLERVADGWRGRVPRLVRYAAFIMQSPKLVAAFVMTGLALLDTGVRSSFCRVAHTEHGGSDLVLLRRWSWIYLARFCRQWLARPGSRRRRCLFAPCAVAGRDEQLRRGDAVSRSYSDRCCGR